MDTDNLLALAPTAFSSATWALMTGTCAVAVTRARRAAPRPIDRAPRVSILKPLAGDDDELAANLASFGELDYPEYEILLGVASPTTLRTAWPAPSSAPTPVARAWW